MLRFKLDENADPRWREPLAEAGYEVSTVAEESLQGAEDGIVAEACQTEERCLITVDLDVAQVLYYAPEKYAGIIVLRHPHPTLVGMTRLIRQILVALPSESPVGRLWIVEPGRIRIHEPFSEEQS